ncbi:MAG: hypothetical protein J1F36_00615 [Clostridiales bacterium]|nr:hypothetical protein [Clostridiales bacterium]
MSKKKKWIIVVSSILAVVAIGLGVGLGVGLSGRIWYKAHIFGGRFGWQDTEEGIFELVTSLDELKEICDTYDNPAFSEEYFAYLTSMGAKLREYDGTYFSDKAVIIFSTTGNSKRFKIKKIYVKNKELILDINYKEYKHGHALWLEYTTIIIEINKADILGITDMKTI